MTVRHLSFVDFPTLSELVYFLKAILQVGKKKTKKKTNRGLLGAHNWLIIAVMIDGLT